MQTAQAPYPVPPALSPFVPLPFPVQPVAFHNPFLVHPGLMHNPVMSSPLASNSSSPAPLPPSGPRLPSTGPRQPPTGPRQPSTGPRLPPTGPRLMKPTLPPARNRQAGRNIRPSVQVVPETGSPNLSGSAFVGSEESSAPGSPSTPA
ncbi:hypothetical protein M426DRAFT_8917 [Hypoxylon sp. CI-4A]|nr:hypothetical protein M426DRAFT_8917 [Hypoxylon sp. CI-4A]